MRLEGVTYQFDWATFEPGRSFFVPCLDDKTGIEKITAIMKRLGFPVIIKVVIVPQHAVASPVIYLPLQRGRLFNHRRR